MIKTLLMSIALGVFLILPDVSRANEVLDNGCKALNHTYNGAMFKCAYISGKDLNKTGNLFAGMSEDQYLYVIIIEARKRTVFRYWENWREIVTALMTYADGVDAIWGVEIRHSGFGLDGAMLRSSDPEFNAFTEYLYAWYNFSKEKSMKCFRDNLVKAVPSLESYEKCLIDISEVGEARAQKKYDKSNPNQLLVF